MSVTMAVNSQVDYSTTPTTSTSNGGMDKDAFMRILITQMQNQDPTKPMDSTAYIAQMAQFSSLEQMTNVNDGLSVLTQMQLTTQALTLVGHNIDLHNPAGGDPITGKVESVKFDGGVPKLVVGGKEYSLSDVLAVR